MSILDLTDAATTERLGKLIWRTAQEPGDEANPTRAALLEAGIEITPAVEAALQGGRVTVTRVVEPVFTDVPTGVNDASADSVIDVYVLTEAEGTFTYVNGRGEHQASEDWAAPGVPLLHDIIETHLFLADLQAAQLREALGRFDAKLTTGANDKA